MRHWTLVPLFSMVVAGSLHAQSDVTVASYREARRVIERAAEALGGQRRLEDIKTVAAAREGWWILRNQSRGAEPPRDSIPQSDAWTLDVARGWATYESHNSAQGIGTFNTRGILQGDKRASLDLDQKTVQTGSGGPLASPFQIWYYMPPLIVKRALERAATLRSLGTATLDGRPHDVVTFAWQDGVDLTLFVDKSTGLLTRTDRLFSDYELGDTVQEYWFEGYQASNGVMMPQRSRVTAGGVRTLDFRTTRVSFDQPIDSAAYAIPADYKRSAGPADAALTKVADGLWYFTFPGAGYNSVVVEFADHLAVLEAPVGPPYSQQLLNRVRAAIPGKPVRYLVLTHQHWDHVAGLAAYAAQQATVITTRLAEPLVRRIVAAAPTLAPDPLRGRPRDVKVETVAAGSKRALSDATNSVEIIHVGATPHVNEMLAVYIPRSKTLFAADWVRVAREGSVDRASPSTRHFLERIRALGLDVETVLDVHGRAVTRAELEGR